MRKLLFLVLLTLATAVIYGQDVPTMTCQFTKFILVQYSDPNTTQTSDVQQSMKIVLGKTDDATMQLDGAKRATNSRVWTNITLKGWETWQSSFLGDFGEVLIVSHELGANKRPLHGWYKASLVTNVAESTSILLGMCFIE